MKKDFDTDVELDVLKAFLVEGKSHRENLKIIDDIINKNPYRLRLYLLVRCRCSGG